ncbi:MAG: histidine phosphatase family protein [Euzebyales bacterium]|nr:histidine phosphatase family protein [Euzebyales bacterium]
MALLLIRHAHAGSKAQWSGEDHLRPLSETGRAQAAGLVRAVSDREVGRVLSSPHTRCTQTVRPLALARGLTVEECDALIEERGDEALALVGALAGTQAALCTHGDVVGIVLSTLAAEGMAVPGDARWAKGSVWVLQHDGSRFRAASYVPPPPVA